MINPHFHNVKRTIFGLKREIRELQTRTAQGVVEGGMYILTEAAKMAPYDTGNLRASGFAVWQHGHRRLGQFTRRKGITSGRRKDVGMLRRNHTQVVARARGQVHFGDMVIGFSAPYALFVHNAPVHYKLHYGERYFLRKSLQRNRKAALGIIYQRAQFGRSLRRVRL